MHRSYQFINGPLHPNDLEVILKKLHCAFIILVVLRANNLPDHILKLLIDNCTDEYILVVSGLFIKEV